MSDRSHWVNSDTEIETSAEDRLGRTPFCRRMVERIVAAGRGPSVVFGLAGPWGSGKTSALNIVADLLAQERGNDWAVVRFTAWSASDVEALTNEFYQAIAAAMPHDTREGQQAVSWLLSMAPVAAAASKAAAVAAIESKLGKGAWAKTSEATVDALADKVGKFKIKPDPFVSRFEKMSKAIDLAGRNVLVVVDDIDRLHTDELLCVIKAVRLLGRFNRVHYLLSYDEQTLLDVLKTSDIASGDEKRARLYLEKIVQYPFLLPPLQLIQIESELGRGLREVADLHGVALSPDGGGRLGAVSRIVRALPDTDVQQMTMRRINRLASQVEVLLTLVSVENLNFTDAVLVTFLRLWYPQLYDQLSRWKPELLKDVRIATFSANRDRMAGLSWSARIREALGTSPSKTEVDLPEIKADLESIERLMSTLFPGAIQKGGMRQEDEECRIHSRDYFDRYLTFGIPVGDVSYAAVRKELESLCANGNLPDNSVFLTMLADPQSAALLLRKASRAVDVIAEAPPQNAAAAATFLTQHINGDDRIYGRWATVICALLQHAVNTASTTEQAQSVVDSFEEAVGLLATAEVLYGSTRLPGGRMTAASKSVASKIVDICCRDLVTDVSREGPNALSCSHFVRLWSSLPAEALDQLAKFASQEISDGRAKDYELAGRFVGVPPVGENGLPTFGPTFCEEQFERLVPRRTWSLDQIPEVAGAEITPGDGSLRNRTKIAAAHMRSLLVTVDSASSE